MPINENKRIIELTEEESERLLKILEQEAPVKPIVTGPPLPKASKEVMDKVFSVYTEKDD